MSISKAKGLIEIRTGLFNRPIWLIIAIEIRLFGLIVDSFVGMFHPFLIDHEGPYG